MEKSNNGAAQTTYSSLKKTSNIDGTIVGYPVIEAIFDAFGIVVDCIEHFETSLRPTLHIGLPAVYRMMQKLDDVSCGKKL